MLSIIKFELSSFDNSKFLDTCWNMLLEHALELIVNGILLKRLHLVFWAD